MNNEKNFIGGLAGCIVSFSGMTLEQADHIVSLICGVIGLVITVVSCIVIPVWKKVRDAMKDKKITPEEAEDITNTLKDGLDKLKNEEKKKKQKLTFLN